MLIKKFLAIMICFSFFISLPAFSISKGDFDKIIDFGITLKELSLTVSKKTTASIDKNKIYIIDGAVTPDKANSFELEAADIVNPLAFVTKLRSKKDALSLFIFNGFSKNLQTELINYNAAQGQDGTIATLIRELKKITRAGSLYTDNLKQELRISSHLRALLEKSRTTEETWYLNRLILEEIYKPEISNHTLLVEAAASEWIGYEKIIMYKCLIRVSGVDSYSFFIRKDTDEEPTDYIPVFSTIVSVVKIDKTVLLEDGTEIWLLDNLYYRKVK
jgi:hypothetical protein